MTIREMIEHLACNGVRPGIIQRIAYVLNRFADADNHPLVMQEGGTDAIDRCLRVINKQAAQIERLRASLAALPTTRDGVAIVPGMEAWVVAGAKAVSGAAPITYAAMQQVRIVYVGDDGVVCATERGIQTWLSIGSLASTREAAERE